MEEKSLAEEEQKQLRQQLVDVFTRIDDLILETNSLLRGLPSDIEGILRPAETKETLDRILEELRSFRQVPSAAKAVPGPDILIVYPPEGGWETVAKGTTTIDLLEGEVVLPDGTEKQTSTSLRAKGFDFAESILIEATKKVTVSLDGWGKYEVKTGEFIPLVHQRFRRAYIDTDESTDIRLWASTNPEGIPQKVLIPQVTHAFMGTPVVRKGRYSGSDTSYQELVSWTVSTGYDGMLHEVCASCKDPTSFTAARFKLTIAGTVQFTDQQFDSGWGFPVPPNKLVAGSVVKIEVKSASGTITAEGTITGKEL